MDPAAVRETLRAFIAKTLIRDAGYPLGDDEPIITAGLIDSFSLAELAVFVERQWGVDIPDPELTVERMNTLDQIVARVLAG
jgi:acyl carrier protein